MAGEIVTKGSRFYCVSLQPDICKTPNGPSTPPIPYTIKGEFAEATGVSANITSNHEQVVIHASTVIPTVTGDEKGTAKGVKSKTVGKRVQHDQKSATVSFNGERAIRVGDTVFMNDKNTIGKVYERAPIARPGPTGVPSKTQVSSPRAMASLEARLNEISALITNAKSVLSSVALDGVSAAISGSPIVRSAPGALAKPIDSNAPSTGALVEERYFSQLNMLRSVSELIPNELLNRIPGMNAVRRIAANIANTPAANRTGRHRGEVDGLAAGEKRTTDDSSPSASTKGDGETNLSSSAGRDGGTSRGKEAGSSRSGEPNARSAGTSTAGKAEHRTQIDVSQEFPDFPTWGSRILNENDVKVFLVKDSVVEAFPWLKGRHPPEHPLDTTYDQISGVFLEEVFSVAIASSQKYASGSFSTAFHELAHPIDLARKFSTGEKFVDAWGADYESLNSNYFRTVSRGKKETFAEGFARYFRGDPSMKKEWPNIFKFFVELDTCMKSEKSDCR